MSPDPSTKTRAPDPSSDQPQLSRIPPRLFADAGFPNPPPVGVAAKAPAPSAELEACRSYLPPLPDQLEIEIVKVRCHLAELEERYVREQERLRREKQKGPEHAEQIEKLVYAYIDEYPDCAHRTSAKSHAETMFWLLRRARKEH